MAELRAESDQTLIGSAAYLMTEKELINYKKQTDEIPVFSISKGTSHQFEYRNRHGRREYFCRSTGVWQNLEFKQLLEIK
jgi:hypothetical protein